MEIKEVKIGFVGYGNMAQAMASGWVNKGSIQPGQIYATARNQEKLVKNCEILGVHAVEFTEDLVDKVDVVILAVKPYQIKDVVEPVREKLQEKIILSVAAGFTYEMYKEILLEGSAHVSTIPNTPVSISEGIIVLEKTHSLSNEEYTLVFDLLSELGLVQPVETEQLDVGGTLAGCGPAFASMFIEALADGAVKYGLSRDEAYKLASQMIVGTGKMQLETNAHPGVMKDQVTSPGGTTIKGVAALEENGFRSAVIQAFDAIEGR